MGKNLSDLSNEINRNLGVTPPKIVLNNTYIRFDINKKNKAGWLIGKEWSYNNKTYFAATYGSWAHSNDYFRFVSWDREEEIQNPGLSKEIELLNEKIEEEQKREAQERKEEILKEFKNFKKLDNCDNHYLQKKQVQTYSGLFEDKNKNLIVPIFEDFQKTLAGYQYITKKNKGFPRGQSYKSNFFFFGNVNESSTVYLCEGVATAATIFEITKIPTVCCFNAGNIPNVASKIKTDLAGKNIVIACDNDKSKAGFDFAIKAKRKLGNALILKPDFGTKNTALSDFNDLFVSQGFDETKKQLSFDSNSFVSVEFLGFSDSNYYFYSTRKKTISSFSFEKIRAGHLQDIARDSYWSQKFIPNFDKDGNPLNSCNWKLSAELIAEKQQEIGFFDGSNIRGMGSWVDKEHHVLNLGNKILVNKKESYFGRATNTSKFYAPSSSNLKLYFNEDPTTDFSAIKKALDLVDFESKRDVVLVLGYLAFAQIFTTQRWRPHLWIRADKGSGKSSLLSFFNDMIQNSLILQDSTAAGIRQVIKHDSKVCLVDEAEGEQYRTKQVLELARQSSSGSGTTIARGTPTGDAITYKPELSFTFASIRMPDLTPADESRIISVFLKKPLKNDPEKNQRRISAFYEAKKLSVDLFSYMNLYLDSFDIVQKEIHSAILDLGFDPRFADQYSPIISGYMLLNPDDNPNEVLKLTLEESFNDLSQNLDENSDQEDFRDVLYQTVIRIGSEEKSISMVFEEIKVCGADRRSYLSSELEKYGIYFLPNVNKFCFLKNNHLKNIISKSSSYRNYWQSFSKNKYFDYKVSKIKGKPQKGYQVT